MKYGKYLIYHPNKNKLFTCNCDSKKDARQLAGKHWGLRDKETEQLTVLVPQVVKR